MCITVRFGFVFCRFHFAHPLPVSLPKTLRETLTLCIPSDPYNFRTCAALYSRYISLQRIMPIHFLTATLSTSFSADRPQDLFTKTFRPLSYAKETEPPNCFRLSQRGKKILKKGASL